MQCVVISKTALQEKIDLAKSFTAMDEQEQSLLIDRVADRAGRIVEFYKA